MFKYQPIVVQPSVAVTTINGHHVRPLTFNLTPELADPAVLSPNYGTSLPSSRISYFAEPPSNAPVFNGPVGSMQLSYGGIKPTGTRLI